MTEKQLALLNAGVNLVENFAVQNKIKLPKIFAIDNISRGTYCGRYGLKQKEIEVYIKRCANLTKVPGFSWSHPAYFVDRTVFGVLCHEFGHHVDNILNKNKGMPKFKDERVSNYEPNACERFAESMKLFLSNPDLLKKSCPKRYEFLTKTIGLIPVVKDSWEQVFKNNNMHERYYDAAKKRIKKTTKKIKVGDENESRRSFQ